MQIRTQNGCGNLGSRRVDEHSTPMVGLVRRLFWEIVDLQANADGQ